MKSKKIIMTIVSIIFTIILIIAVMTAFKIFKSIYFNGFEKAVGKTTGTKFSRDSEVKFSEYYSYKIENTQYNDSAFFKEVEVEPYTPYRITCMVKTENVECEQPGIEGGVSIGLLETTQYSPAITGTNDWQKLEFIFNSKNATTAKISFRLGGNQNDCKGTAWFSDFKLEKGTKNSDTEWKVGCFLINELDINIEGTQYNLKLNTQDKENARLNLHRFANDCYEFSDHKMTVNYEICEVNEPVTSITHSEEHGYHITPGDLQHLIYDTVKENKYDHIFVVCRMESEDGKISIPIHDNWIGLGSMDMYDIGFSLIRINKNNLYQYGLVNQAPEEVFLHEFLHTLERNCKDAGYEIIELHDHEKYGYTEVKVDALNDWYIDYMQERVYDKTNNKYVGLKKDYVYTTQPFNDENFKYSIEQELIDEPENIIEEIHSIIKVLTKQF